MRLFAFHKVERTITLSIARPIIGIEPEQDYIIGTDTCVWLTVACRYALNCISKLVKTTTGYFCTCCNQLKGNSVIGALIISASIIASKAQSRSCIMMKSILP